MSVKQHKVVPPAMVAYIQLLEMIVITSSFCEDGLSSALMVTGLVGCGANLTTLYKMVGE